jgi:hypothetical protein
VRDNLRVEEVRVGDGDAARRFIVCHNSDEADRDKQTRDDTMSDWRTNSHGSPSLARKPTPRRRRPPITAPNAPCTPTRS